jgi:hypothetical protein
MSYDSAVVVTYRTAGTIVAASGPMIGQYTPLAWAYEPPTCVVLSQC